MPLSTSRVVRLRISKSLGLLDKLLGISERTCFAAIIVLINVLVASVSVIWFWVATEAQLGSWLPSLRSGGASNSLTSWLLASLFAINVLQLCFIYARGRTLANSSPDISQQRRSYRVAIGKVWPSVAAFIEILIFRMLWSGYQIHSVTPNSGASIVGLLQAYGGALLIFGWLSWVNRKTVRSMSRVFGGTSDFSVV
jgi:hypothetical protein